MAIVRSRIEDNTHIYSITNGSGREGLLVYLTTTANTVALAIATSMVTSRIAGVITEDYGTTVEMSSSGDVMGIKETAVLIDPGDTLFLSGTDLGKITNVAPTTVSMVVSNVGKASSVSGNDVQFNMQLITPIEL